MWSCCSLDLGIKERTKMSVFFLSFFLFEFPFCITDDRCIARLLTQWSYGFYLIHIQGQNGLEVYCKTKDLKKKWLEQFQMAL